MSQKEKYSYVTKHLDVIRNGLLVVSSDEEFKKAVYSEVEKKFDGDDNVLLKTLLNALPNYVGKMVRSKYIHDAAFEVSIDAFNDIIDGDYYINLFPQIYIPNYEKFKVNRTLTRNNPTIVSFNGDESGIEWSGIKITNEGDFIEVKVDESYLAENEVWVISLSDGKIPATEDDITQVKRKSSSNLIFDCIQLNEKPCNASPSSWTDIYTYKWNITCLKESPLSGNADVGVTVWTCFKDYINPVTGGNEPLDWFGDPEYRLIAKLNINYLYDCWQPNPNLPYHSTFPIIKKFSAPTIPNESGGVGDVLYYVIFEHDNWPSPMNYKTLTPSWGGNTLNIGYRSSQSDYGAGVFSATEKCLLCNPDYGTTACAHKWDNSCGEFTFYKK